MFKPSRIIFVQVVQLPHCIYGGHDPVPNLSWSWKKKFVKLKHSYLYELVKKKSSWNQYVPGISATTWADFGSMWKTSELWKTCSSWNISQRDTKLIINGECKRLRSSGSSFVFWSWISVARCDSKYLVLIKIFLKIS